MSSQSGALGIALVNRARQLGLGVSSFASVGNKADVSGNDLLQYWESDDATDVILLYLEGFGNPRRFSRIARRVSRRKPIVAVKSGRTAGGARAASSHTAALASSDRAADALFAQTGIIRVDTLAEFFAVARLLATQPIPAGNKIDILIKQGAFSLQRPNRSESRLVAKEIRNPSFGIRVALTSDVEFTNRGGNNNANRNNRKNDRSP